MGSGLGDEVGELILLGCGDFEVREDDQGGDTVLVTDLTLLLGDVTVVVVVIIVAMYLPFGEDILLEEAAHSTGPSWQLLLLSLSLSAALSLWFRL